jgi:pyruvate/2-oxoglutarate dehydrogenase complex dihydrolipoamide acyltransferase (E2) component
MEVETDKAVMEVEALADGFLAAVSAQAGDHVPVGQVVAMIAETAGAAEHAAPASPAPQSSDEPVHQETSSSDALPEGEEIIMPALGMAQDTGLIVAWRKKPGDAVAAGDILLEVETDKSVMEVEAGHDGFVAAILADAQQAVPVGSVIAIITAEKPENAVARSHKAAPAQADKVLCRSRNQGTTGDTAKAADDQRRALYRRAHSGFAQDTPPGNGKRPRPATACGARRAAALSCLRSRSLSGDSRPIQERLATVLTRSCRCPSDAYRRARRRERLRRIHRLAG